MRLTNEARPLPCPGCGGGFLHHSTIEVFDRAEDAGDGETLRVRIGDGRVEVDRTNKDNPSARRSGLRIELRCEACPTRSFLTVAQHKGETQVWVQAEA